jgi:hypothetical protein
VAKEHRMEATNSNIPTNEKVFERRYDHYWKYLAVYSIALMIYSFVKGTIVDHTFSLVWKEPIFLLISFFMLYSLLSLGYNMYKKMSIIIGDDFIELRNRFRIKRYQKNELLKIAVGKERQINIREQFKIIKFKVEGRRRIIRIRPSSFYHSNELLSEIIRLKQSLSF